MPPTTPPAIAPVLLEDELFLPFAAFERAVALVFPEEEDEAGTMTKDVEVD